MGNKVVDTAEKVGEKIKGASSKFKTAYNIGNATYDAFKHFDDYFNKTKQNYLDYGRDKGQFGVFGSMYKTAQQQFGKPINWVKGLAKWGDEMELPGAHDIRRQVDNAYDVGSEFYDNVRARIPGQGQSGHIENARGRFTGGGDTRPPSYRKREATTGLPPISPKQPRLLRMRQTDW